MRYLWSAILILSTLTAGFAQTSSPYNKALSFSYFGETVTHYGPKAGYERSVRSRSKTRNNGKDKQVDILLGVDISMYRHPNNHYGLLLSPGATLRRTNFRGGILELSLSPTYFRQFLDGKTYEVDGGQLKEISLASRGYFMPTIAIGFGRNLSYRHQIPITWRIKPHFMFQMPYSVHTVLPRIALELGIIYHL